MSQVYSSWKEFYPYINTLPNERSIYLHSPYEFVPPVYIDNVGFFNEWLSINQTEDTSKDTFKDTHLCQSKIIVLNYKPRTLTSGLLSCDNNHNSGKMYHTDVTYYDHDNSGDSTGVKTHRQIKELNTYHIVDHNKLGKEIQIKWYSNGQLECRFHFVIKVDEKYKDMRFGKTLVNPIVPTIKVKDGLQEEWYENDNGQLKYRVNYIDGQGHGLTEMWYENGKLRVRSYYNNGMVDGPMEEW